MGSRRHNRSPIMSFIRSHIVFSCMLIFTISTATFTTYHLGFFSTLLIYLPVAILYIPASAALDAFDLSNRSHWSPSRKARFGLSIAWCLFLVLTPRYPISGPSSYLHPQAPLPTMPRNHTYFIAANLYNSAPVLPAWTREMQSLIDHLGPRNVFVSIYESNSHDQTKPMLRAFEEDLRRRGVENNILLEDADGRNESVRWSLNGHERIRHMAQVRNKVLEPLQITRGLNGRTFDRVLFFNDVYFDWRSIIRLLATHAGAFDLACALDFDGVGLYDIWVTRDSCGRPVKEIWPYFSSDHTAIDNLRRDRPIEVASCWNGVAAFDARWFLARNPNNNTPDSVVTPTPTTGPFTTPNGPLRFRDNDACAASECFLISFDMHLKTAPRRPRIYINPQVNVAYTPLNYLFHTRLTHLTLARPWRVLWEDWIASRWFGWVSDWVWLKRDKCGRGEGMVWEGIVKGRGCRDT